MSSNQDDNTSSCLGCLLFLALLIFGYQFHFLWAILFVLLIIGGLSDNQASVPKSNDEPSHPLVPDDLDNILIDLSNGEIKDPVTQESFQPGEKVYLCHVHRLAYHQDSWQEIGYQCIVCANNAHTKEYTLPQPVIFPEIDSDIELEIEFRDIE